MKLKSFRILNCFGFWDSDEIDLSDPGNLMYFLGRNSSGKTSVLRAISYLELGKKPRDHPNFMNYERLVGSRMLRARFSLDPVGDRRLSVDTLMTNVIQHFGDAGLRAQQEEGGFSVSGGGQGISQATKLLNNVHQIYSNLIDHIHKAGNVWVEKHEDGSYRFVTEEGNYEDFEQRQGDISAQVGHMNSPRRNHGETLVKTSFEDIEALLFMQFPDIFFFSDRFSLSENLPRSLSSEHLDGGQNALTQALVSLLGPTTLTNLLHASKRQRIKTFEEQAQNRLDKLCAKINEGRSADETDVDFLRIHVDRDDNIRIILEVDGKESYYEHLSDNTKFLVAYHILQEDRDRKSYLPSILLFDEPSKGFHPSAETKVLRFLDSLAAADNQILISTHSQHMIDLDRLTAVRIMSRAEDGTLRVRNRLYGSSGASKDTLALQPITEAIGLRYADQAMVRDKVVVVEGYTDLLYLRYFARLLGTAEPNIAPTTGDNKIPTFIPFLISQGISFKIALDSSEFKARLQRTIPIPDDSFYIIEQQLAGNAGRTVGIEDLYSKADFRMLLERYGHSVDEERFEHVSNSNYAKIPGLKALIAREVYESTGLARSHFSEATIDNFQKLLNFCENDSWFKA